MKTSRLPSKYLEYTYLLTMLRWSDSPRWTAPNVQRAFSKPWLVYASVIASTIQCDRLCFLIRLCPSYNHHSTQKLDRLPKTGWTVNVNPQSPDGANCSLGVRTLWGRWLSSKGWQRNRLCPFEGGRQLFRHVFQSRPESDTAVPESESNAVAVYRKSM